MDEIEYKAVIKYLVLKGKTNEQITGELYSVCGLGAPSYSTVNLWAAERGRISLSDGERSGRPKTATTDIKIAQVHKMVLDNRQIKIREIAKAMNMSKERLGHILSQDLGLRKLLRTFQTSFEEKAASHQVPTSDNYFQQISYLWAVKLQKMPPLQQILAEKFTNDILLEGQLGTLHRHSMQLSASSNLPVDASADKLSSSFEEITKECSN